MNPQSPNSDDPLRREEGPISDSTQSPAIAPSDPFAPPANEETRSERLGRLLRKARALPDVAGVYLMKDAAGTVLYVGKASVLPNRVASYFIPSADLGFRKQPMLDVVIDFDFIPCEGEWEALLMEARLVKDIHPPFNDRLQDDKTFPYLAVTMRDDFPGVYITRNPGDERFRGAKLFGPFVSVGSLRHAMQLLQRVFKYRTCELEIMDGDPKNRLFRPCLLAAINQCTAPCAARIPKEEYRADIDRFLRFVGSKRSAMLREMREEMDAASRALEFERAAVLRDQIKAIEKLDERETRNSRDDDGEFDWQPEATGFVQDPAAGARSLARALGLDSQIRCMEAIDIAHLRGGETVASKVCFIDGKPFKEGYRRYRITTVTNDDYSAMREVVSRRYRDAGDGEELYPDLILIDGGIGQLRAAMDAFAQLRVQPPRVISLAKREELIYTTEASEPIRLGREHLGLKLCQAIRDEAHRFAQHYHHLLREKSLLGETARKVRKKRAIDRLQHERDAQIPHASRDGADNSDNSDNDDGGEA
ncbi:MAG: UvrB/UvrC motif-containing protein [Limnohabitans sp.]|nr:UvrB/UvrC motif-containing protein [Limnohabitans sp.]